MFTQRLASRPHGLETYVAVAASVRASVLSLALLAGGGWSERVLVFDVADMMNNTAVRVDSRLLLGTVHTSGH